MEERVKAMAKDMAKERANWLARVAYQRSVWNVHRMERWLWQLGGWEGVKGSGKGIVIRGRVLNTERWAQGGGLWMVGERGGHGRGTGGG